MSANKSPKSTLAENPHFQHIGRAPYELGRLLQALPANFSALLPATPDALLMAEAAAQHAGNANDTILNGLEALGKVLFSAGLNEDCPVGGNHLASIGYLISHLTVEAQFLLETENDLRHTLRQHGGSA
jgi:hypothetical protein